jgi:hypothetical protein
MPRLGRRPDNVLDLDLADEEADHASWTVRLARNRNPTGTSGASGWSDSPEARLFRGDGFEVHFGDRSANALYDPRRAGASFAAAQLAVFGALRREGRADLHASAVVPPGSSDAVVLVGESGHGKSTLTLTALSLGWGFLSDDLVAVFSDQQRELVLSPLRRTVRVSEAAISLLPESARSGNWTVDSPRKLIVDPEACGLGRRHSRARPHRLVFLERGPEKAVRALSSMEAFERLMLQSTHLAYDPDAKSAIGALKRLADEVSARSAVLPLDSLYDAATLEDFLT